MTEFRTLKLATEFYLMSRNLGLRGHLSDQLDRAASSIALNLNEGSGRFSKREQRHFYHIAFGSLRECQAILLLLNLKDSAEWKKLDEAARSLFCLIRALSRG